MVKVFQFFFRSSWQKIALAALLSCISAGLNILSIKYLSDIITEDEIVLLRHVISIAIFVSVSAVVTVFSSRSITRHFEFKVATYRKDLAERVLRTNYQKIEKYSHSLVPVLMFEVSAVGSFGALIPEALVAAFQLIAVLVYLFTLSWEMTLITSVLLILLAIVNMSILPGIATKEANLSKVRFRLHYLLDRFEKGIKDLFVNSDHSDRYIHKSIELPSREVAAQNFGLFMTKLKMDNINMIIIFVGFALILSFARGIITIPQKDLIQYLTLLLFIRPAINRISGFVKQVKNVENALEQIEKFDVNIRESKYIETKEIVEVAKPQIPLIRIKNISYSYETSGFKIGPLSFDIHKNELVIIKGGNGSGKSTLFKLIVGLYKPLGGKIEYEGQRVNDTLQQSYRTQFSCYFTGSPVFDDLGYLQNQDIQKSARQIIELLEIQKKTQLGQDLLIEETNLSHGQQGRLNLFRMLLEDKPIYFFDEWAANQDVHFKEKFYTEIIPDLKSKGKTVILISHDDKYYHIADKIISLRNGLIE